MICYAPNFILYEFNNFVVPGTRDTLAIFLLLNILFINDDLPLFERPININYFVFNIFYLSYFICYVKYFASLS